MAGRCTTVAWEGGESSQGGCSKVGAAGDDDDDGDDRYRGVRGLPGHREALLGGLAHEAMLMSAAVNFLRGRLRGGRL